MTANVLQARVIQWIHSTKVAFLPDVVERIRERYHFVITSENIAEVVAKNLPLGFRHGKLQLPDRSVVIEGLAIHRQAIIVDVGSNTDDSDEVLKDLLNWATEEFAISLGPRLYASQLEVRFEIDFRRSFPLLSAVADQISQFNRTINAEFEGHRPEFHFAAISLNPDPAGSALACGFRLERREGQPYAANMYFAEAPLSTAEHIRVLAELQEAMRAEVVVRED